MVELMSLYKEDVQWKQNDLTLKADPTRILVLRILPLKWILARNI